MHDCTIHHPHISADLPESRHIAADCPESRHVIAVIPSHADLSLLKHVDSIFLGGTVSKLSGLPAATQSSSPGTAPSVSEIDDVLSVLPVMAMAILCVWATHTTVVAPEVAASTAEPSEVVAPLYSLNPFPRPTRYSLKALSHSRTPFLNSLFTLSWAKRPLLNSLFALPCPVKQIPNSLTILS